MSSQPCRLFVFRHGEASFRAATDFERLLTPSGVRQTEKVVAHLSEAFNDLDQVSTELWASPLYRAQQTAQLVSSHLDLAVQTKDYLTPDDHPVAVVDNLIAAGSTPRNLILVSHMPLVSGLIAYLQEGHVRPQYSFQTSECVVLEGADILPGCMTIKQSFY